MTRHNQQISHLTLSLPPRLSPIHRFAEENAQFNLMAVVKDQVLEHEEKMKAQIFLKGVVEKQLDEIDKEWAKSDNIQQVILSGWDTFERLLTA